MESQRGAQTFAYHCVYVCVCVCVCIYILFICLFFLFLYSHSNILIFLRNKCSLKGCTCLIKQVYYHNIRGIKWSSSDNNIVYPFFFIAS